MKGVLGVHRLVITPLTQNGVMVQLREKSGALQEPRQILSLGTMYHTRVR